MIIQPLRNFREKLGRFSPPLLMVLFCFIYWDHVFQCKNKTMSTIARAGCGRKYPSQQND